MTSPTSSTLLVTSPTANSAAALAQLRAMGEAMVQLVDTLGAAGLRVLAHHGPAPRLLAAEEYAKRMGVELETVNQWCRDKRFRYARMPFNNKRVGWRIPEGYLYGDELPLEQAQWFERYWKEQEASSRAVDAPASTSQAKAASLAKQGETESCTHRAEESRAPELVAVGTDAEFDVNALDLKRICHAAGRGQGATTLTPSTGRRFGSRKGDRKGASAAAHESEKVG